MNAANNILLVGDSRVRSLKYFIRNELDTASDMSTNLQILCVPGGTIRKVTREAIELFGKSHTYSRKFKQVYFMAGVCDLTTRDRVTKKLTPKYSTQNTLRLSLQESYDQIWPTLQSIAEVIIICELIGSDIAACNRQIGSHQEFQMIQNFIIPKINIHIKTINMTMNCFSPQCPIFSHYVYKIRKGRAAVRLYLALKDGVHFTEDFALRIGKKIVAAIKDNTIRAPPALEKSSLDHQTQLSRN